MIEPVMTATYPQERIKGANNTIDYTGDLVTGQKSGEEIWQDVSSAGEAYAKPFMDLKGEDNRTMLTLKEQESYDAGRNDVNAAVRVVDTVTAVAGGASLVKNGVKVLKGGGKKSGHADGDGAKGGVPHGHGDGPDGTSGGAMKDGKLMTNAALMPSSLAELGERINQTLDKMTAGAAASVPWRVQRVRLSNGQTVPVIVKNDSHMFSDTGGNRGKGSDSGSSKGSPNTSHVDSRESSVPKGIVSKESATSSNVTPTKPKDASKLKDAPSSKDGTKARDGKTEGTGDTVSVIKNNFEYLDGFDDHLINAQSIVRKGNKGVVGGHNLESFEKILTDQGWSLEDLIVSKTPHPTTPGIYQIQYRLPALDRELKVIPGQYKNISHPKTVYDPKVISNDQIIQWGKEAMANGEIVGREVRGTASNGLKFTGYLDENGKVTNFFPTISE
ncbi:EndoU nuclease-like protein [Paenibacillus pabuli]|uniref:EndoU nuclease-like protein n=2 Tax=Paenibacillus pabuli TaxID=1472 RepID=A0ABX9BAU0_9BACL|nr:EndoU nuclease-like protein [Paenibacillus pabuli]